MQYPPFGLRRVPIGRGLLGAGACAASGGDDAATHVGRTDGAARATAAAIAPDARAPDTGTPHVGRARDDAHEHIRAIAAQGGARGLLRLVTAALGVPLRSLTPQLRRQVFARDGHRCVVPGCRHHRFIDVHHVVPRAAGGAYSIWMRCRPAASGIARSTWFAGKTA